LTPERANQHTGDVETGARPFVVGALGEVIIAFLTLGLVFGPPDFFHKRIERSLTRR
jgi:hypothetical protein